MTMWVLFIAALTCVASADPFHLGVWVQDSHSDGSIVASWRIWYGDGQAFVGPTVPPEVQVAFNITFTGLRSMLLDIAVDGTSSSSPSLPDPTFLVINTTIGAAEPMFFTHSAVNLTEDYVYLWASTDGIVMPQSRRERLGSASSLGASYLGETSIKGTYKLLWVVDRAKAEEKGLRKATINSRDRY